MIDDTIRRIEKAVRDGSLGAAREGKLLLLLEELRAELRSLEATRRADAERIAALTESAHEGARAGAPGGESADRLVKSVRELEASHPRLVRIVESVAETLASAGL